MSNLDFGSSSVGKILEERRKTLMSYCAGKEMIGKFTETEVKKNLLYDIKHKFIYCAVEKVGTRFWRRLFQIISGVSSASSPYELDNPLLPLPDLSLISFDYIHYVLKSSTNFIIVRDPYARLFSAYINKLFEINPPYWKFMQPAIKMFRETPSKTSLECGHDITFPELVKYFIHTEKIGYNRDGHFKPITDHCRPCQIQYDIIAKLETLQVDTFYVLNNLNISNAEQLMNAMKNLGQSSEIDSIKDTSSQLLYLIDSVPQCITRAEGLRRIWRSFQFRGFIGKDVKYSLTRNEESDIETSGIVQMLERAMKISGERKLRLKNRQLVLEEAYSQVPLEDLLELSDIFKNDCGAFGYDCKPVYIFNKTEKPETNFLDIWSA
ncbi:hypothetical protein SNE40_011494 [Patella caerulea]|uniref:Carbohydrate sulfotransferase n=1 Tax=Patella caerulea TaxID=87958 RepID=A0AAN8JJS4_PATCE